MFSFYQTKTKAFTLIEVLVAMFFLFITIFAAVSLVNTALSTTQNSKEKFIAANLAQEGIEIVRNIRDSNWINGVEWKNGLSIGDWEASYQLQNLQSYQARNLNIGADDFYSYEAGIPTKFKRKISINIITIDRIRVASRIEWTEKGKNYNLTAVEDLYNWFGGLSEPIPSPPPPPSLYSDGTLCSFDSQCDSTHCVDGYCCDSTCADKICQTCGIDSNRGAGACGYINNTSQDLGCAATGCLTTGNCSGIGYTCEVPTAGTNPNNYCTASYNACSGNNRIGPDGKCDGSGNCNTTGLSDACAVAGVCQTGGGCSGGSCVGASVAPNTNWGANLYGCSGADTRCYSGTCRDCSDSGGYLYSDGCSGCAGQGGFACWRKATNSYSCTLYCSSYGVCVAANWNDVSGCPVCRLFHPTGTCRVISSGVYPGAWGYGECTYRGAVAQDCAATTLETYWRFCVCAY